MRKDTRHLIVLKVEWVNCPVESITVSNNYNKTTLIFTFCEHVVVVLFPRFSRAWPHALVHLDFLWFYSVLAVSPWFPTRLQGAWDHGSRHASLSGISGVLQQGHRFSIYRNRSIRRSQKSNCCSREQASTINKLAEQLEAGLSCNFPNRLAHFSKTPRGALVNTEALVAHDTEWVDVTFQ